MSLFNNYSLKQYLKFSLLLMALSIGLFSLFYSNKMVKNLSIEERKKIKQWAEAFEMLNQATEDDDISFYANILESNTTIPVILADENGIISHRNLDTVKLKRKNYLNDYYQELKSNQQEIKIRIADNDYQYVYYDDSTILKQLKSYPFYQLGIVALFIIVSYFAFSYSRKSEQNQVWVGLARETAHQLGTPMSSLMAWVDLMELDPQQANEETYAEMRKDLDRLKMITDRFSKIGSIPILKKSNIVDILDSSIDYMRTRSPETVSINMIRPQQPIYADLNIPLFEWVVENLCKNAIDAMEGHGEIIFNIKAKGKILLLDVSDNGKGMPKSLFKSVFRPGFTTKKRGWGLGLSLVKRIIENYHKGHISVKESVPNKRTTFRIVLKLSK
ncbi:MAG: HAMP domain-containing sensor histidine kinase [Bacteroidota bacterium]